MRPLHVAVVISFGFITLLTYFFPTLLGGMGKVFTQWAVILVAFALILGLVNLLRVHLSRIVRRSEPGMGFSLVVVVTATIVFVIGILFGLANGPMTWIFDNVYLPLESAFFALTAFFLATAAYRALRARNWETLLMLIAALIVFVGQMPFVNAMTGDLTADLKNWLLSVPSEAGVRGILIGVGLGTIATGLRLIVGMDRPYSE